jgi:hypothetical protein
MRHIAGKTCIEYLRLINKEVCITNCVVGRYSGEKVKEMRYFALARPNLEYAASIWDPGHEDLNRRQNKIERKAAHFVKKLNKRTQSATQLIEGLG